MPNERATLIAALLRLLPSRWHAALDAWSYRLARKHAQRRRQGGRRADTGKLRAAVKP